MRKGRVPFGILIWKEGLLIWRKNQNISILGNDKCYEH